MYRIVEGSTKQLPDVEAFVRDLNMLNQHALPEVRNLFDSKNPIYVARGPGRLDVMGGIADYSGSLVLELPLAEATLAAVQRDPTGWIRIVSLGAEENKRAADFEMPLADLVRDGKPLEYEEARAYFYRDRTRQWAAYVAGAFLVLMREVGTRFADGARILIRSSVPEGKAVSSSAALEVASMKAIAALFGIELAPRTLAILCQKVENLVVGAPCGVMDQMTSACGEAHSLLALLCQPAELKQQIAIPDDLRFWGIDSGVRHTVSGSDYTSVRVGTFMGYRIIAELAGLESRHYEGSQVVRIRDTQWNGYLANLTPTEFEGFAMRLPERLRGGEFLFHYHGTPDHVTRVEDDRIYAVRVPTAHPVYEHSRVRRFAESLLGKTAERGLEWLGELMYESHASYSACGLGSEATDRLVSLVREMGPASGLYGAKITGGGSGGTVAVLGRDDAQAAVEAVAERYATFAGYRPQIFSGSSPGAAAFGYLRLERN